MKNLINIIKQSPFAPIARRLYVAYRNLEFRKISKNMGYDITLDGKALAKQKDKNASSYMHSPSQNIQKLMPCFYISKTDKIFDYGSGKGGMMIWLAKNYPFGKVAGIEFIANYDAIAKQNFEKNNLAYLETYCADAAKFEDIDEYNYFYFYNPFRGELMQQVIEQIRKSYTRNRRRITVIYLNPQCREMFVDSELFPFTKFCNFSLKNRTADRESFIDIYCTEILQIDFEQLGITVEK